MKTTPLRFRRLRVLAAVAALSVIVVPVRAQPFLEPVVSGPESNSSLEQCGSGTLKAYALFTVGEGTLYRPDCNSEWELLAAEPRRMVFRYARDIPANAFRESATFLLEKQGFQINEAVKAFNRQYRDIQEGDTYVLEYRPGEGLSLYRNDEWLAVLTDDRKAREYFAIWLGERPFDTGLKEELLGIDSMSRW